MTRETAYQLARELSCGDEVDEGDVECALYWYAADYHEGQDSDLYALLSTSPYRPGMMERGPEPESFAAMLYDALAAGMEPTP